MSKQSRRRTAKLETSKQQRRNKQRKQNDVAGRARALRPHRARRAPRGRPRAPPRGRRGLPGGPPAGGRALGPRPPRGRWAGGVRPSSLSSRCLAHRPSSGRPSALPLFAWSSYPSAPALAAIAALDHHHHPPTTNNQSRHQPPTTIHANHVTNNQPHKPKATTSAASPRCACWGSSTTTRCSTRGEGGEGRGAVWKEGERAERGVQRWCAGRAERGVLVGEERAEEEPST